MSLYLRELISPGIYNELCVIILQSKAQPTMTTIIMQSYNSAAELYSVQSIPGTYLLSLLPAKQEFLGILSNCLNGFDGNTIREYHLYL